MITIHSGTCLLIELASQMYGVGRFFSRARTKNFAGLMQEPEIVRPIRDVLADLELAGIDHTPVEVRTGHTVSSRTLFNALVNIIAAHVAMVFDKASRTVRSHPDGLDIPRLALLADVIEGLIDLDEVHDIVRPDHVQAIRQYGSRFVTKAPGLARRLDLDARILDSWADSKNNKE